MIPLQYPPHSFGLDLSAHSVDDFYGREGIVQRRSIADSGVLIDPLCSAAQPYPSIILALYALPLLLYWPLVNAGNLDSTMPA